MTLLPLPTPTPTSMPQARLVVALEERLAALQAGDSQSLSLVVRNDGELDSAPMTLIDRLPVSWHILSVSASKGLTSIQTGEVRIVLGRIRAHEQVVVVVTVQAPAVASAADQHCALLRDGTFALPEICAPLPEVLARSSRSGIVAERVRTSAAPIGPVPQLALLGNSVGESLPGQGGATLVVHNEAAESATNAYLYLELSGDWRVSDVATTLGLVSMVDRAVVIRLGRLDSALPIAITLRGWQQSESQAGFCATLVSDGQQRQRLCGQLLLDGAQIATG